MLMIRHYTIRCYTCMILIRMRSICHIVGLPLQQLERLDSIRHGDHESMMDLQILCSTCKLSFDRRPVMPHVSRKLSNRNFFCLKFSEVWLESENICTWKLQIWNFTDAKISWFTVGTCTFTPIATTCGVTSKQFYVTRLYMYDHGKFLCFTGHNRRKQTVRQLHCMQPLSLVYKIVRLHFRLYTSYTPQRGMQKRQEHWMDNAERTRVLKDNAFLSFCIFVLSFQYACTFRIVCKSSLPCCYVCFSHIPLCVSLLVLLHCPFCIILSVLLSFFPTSLWCVGCI